MEIKGQPSAMFTAGFKIGFASRQMGVPEQGHTLEGPMPLLVGCDENNKQSCGPSRLTHFIRHKLLWSVAGVWIQGVQSWFCMPSAIVRS